MNMRSRTLQSLGVSALGLGLLTLLWSLGPADVAAIPPDAGTPELRAGSTSTTSADAGVLSAPTTATIVFATAPAVNANVFWGRKKIGQITPSKPLVVVRPRDSGPMDVIIRTTNYLAVQVRAHTFSDQRVVVKLTPPDKKSELLGYKAPLDAGVDMSQAAALEAMADAGVSAPSVAPALPPSPGAAPVPAAPIP